MDNDHTFITDKEKSWATLVHLSAFLGCLLPLLGSIIGPVVVWLLGKDDLPFLKEQGAEAINFNISMTIYLLIAGLLSYILIGIPFLIALYVIWILSTIVAAMRAHKGVHFRYPITMRFIKS